MPMARRSNVGLDDDQAPADAVGVDGAGVDAPSAFALSRIQAEGWRAGRLADASAAQADRLNPYKTPIERARWRAGFDAGLQRAGR